MVIKGRFSYDVGAPCDSVTERHQERNTYENLGSVKLQGDLGRIGMVPPWYVLVRSRTSRNG